MLQEINLNFIIEFGPFYATSVYRPPFRHQMIQIKSERVVLKIGKCYRASWLLLVVTVFVFGLYLYLYLYFSPLSAVSLSALTINRYLPVKGNIIIIREQ